MKTEEGVENEKKLGFRVEVRRIRADTEIHRHFTNISVGAGFFSSGFVVDDVDWRHLLPWSSCTPCGVCPAHLCRLPLETEVLIRHTRQFAFSFEEHDAPLYSSSGRALSPLCPHSFIHGCCHFLALSHLTPRACAFVAACRCSNQCVPVQARLPALRMWEALGGDLQRDGSSAVCSCPCLFPAYECCSMPCCEISYSSPLFECLLCL